MTDPTCYLQGHGIWDNIYRIPWHDDVLREAPAPTAKANESVLITAVDQAFLARPARAIVYDGLYRHPRSNFDIVNILADFLHNARELMADSQWHLLVGEGMGRRGHDAGAAHVLMKILADASVSEGVQYSKILVPEPHIPAKAGRT